MTRPHHINPVQWAEAIGYARLSCARVFRNGGSPADALKSFGLASTEEAAQDWSKAVERIALASCSGRPLREAA